MEKAERIAKVMAAAGLCSRRDAEQWILDGRVQINGKKLLTPAQTVTDADHVLVDGRPLRQKAQTRLWLFHKPVDVVTTAKDPEGRVTVFELLPKSMGRVISIGRLDINSEGLLLLTNDGGFSRQMELPATGLPREYEVRVRGQVSNELFAPLKKGITIEGVNYRGIEVLIENSPRDSANTWLQVRLHEGKNREIRRVMQHLGLHVNRLIRTSYGPFELGDLAKGKTHEVPAHVLAAFCEEIGYRS